MHKRKLREVKSAIRPLQEKPYAPQIQMRNAKKDAMLERKYIDYHCLFLSWPICANALLLWSYEHQQIVKRLMQEELI